MLKSYRKLILIGTLLAIIPQLALAQGWMRTFGGPNGDAAYWVEVTYDSGFIVVGNMLVDFNYHGNPGTGVYGYLEKTDSKGNTQWSGTYPPQGIVQHSRFYCIQQTADSGYVVVGEQKVWLERATEHLWLLKLTPDGDTMWTQTYGWDVHDDRGVFVRQTPDHGYIITGYTESRTNDPRQKDLWVLRTDSLGDTLWSRIYGDDTEFDWGACVNLTSDSNYIVTGANGVERSTWVLKIDDSGEIVWSRTYRIEYNDNWGQYVEETSDGGYIITGAAVDNSRLFILKIDDAGDSLWTKSYGTNNVNGGYCVHETPDGGYIIAGKKNHQGGTYATGDAWLLKTDALGDTVWTRIIRNGLDAFNSFRCVQPVFDNGYIITGTAGYYDAETGYDMWLVRTDSLGFVGIEEIDTPPVVENISTIDSSIEFSYTNLPGGFHAYVYDVSGQKVSEIHNTSMSGTVEWGQGQQAGVYFIRELSDTPSVRKVVLVR